MKRILLRLVLYATFPALLLTGCTWFGPPRLVVDPEAVTQVDEMLSGMARSGTFTGSVLIAQDGKVLLSRGYGLVSRSVNSLSISLESAMLGSSLMWEVTHGRRPAQGSACSG